MKNSVYPLLLCLMVVAPGVHAATEAIPINAYRASGDFRDINTGTVLDVDDETSYGFILQFDAGHDSRYEFLYSDQSSRLRAGVSLPTNVLFDIDITYIHVGGNRLFPINDSTSSYLGAGLGIARFDPDFSGYNSESKFSFNVSGGIRKMLTRSIGLRAGLSFYATPVNSRSSIFCGSDSGCTVRFQGDFFTQYDASVGLVIRF